MYTLTLWQPYASLIAEGLKQYETRSWATAYRGVMMIHASAKWDAGMQLATNELARRVPGLSNYWNRELPLGCIVCAVDLVAIHKTKDIRSQLSKLEQSVGNYADGRYAWEMKVVKVPPSPIPAKGKQGLWKWEAE